MAELIFTDDKNPQGDYVLNIDVKPDQIEWAYGLNTQVIPTYGGEVIQILSAFIENMTVSGQVRTYKKAEEIFQWFVKRIQAATQEGQFKHQTGVKMQYPERGWEFRVLPLSIGPLKYGRDLVVPEWSATFHVVQPDQDVMARLVDSNGAKDLADRMGVEGGLLFGKATGNIGYETDDPFRSPVGIDENNDGVIDDPKERKKYNDLYKAIIGGEAPRYETADLGDWFNNLIPSYLQGDFDDLTADYSRPAFGNREKQAAGERNQGTVEAEKYIRARTQ